MNLAYYAKLASGKQCISCAKTFVKPIIIQHYDHSDGWLVDGFIKHQWLYITCSYCDYQNALWKLNTPGRRPKNVQYNLANNRTLH
ncbi:MAG TPA: hypothetical protein VJB56_00380 [Candidatus Paceibacterota bacterium]